MAGEQSSYNYAHLTADEEMERSRRLSVINTFKAAEVGERRLNQKLAKKWLKERERDEFLRITKVAVVRFHSLHRRS